MRQARKLEILNFIDSLRQAHDKIKKAMKRREMTSAQVMQVECQKSVVEFGNAIEETEREDCITVSHVEEYCEAIFCVYGELYSQEQADVSENQTMYHESGKYPKNIEITDWQSCHLEERKQDIIFIRNPFDECNYMTSVHPMYYVRN